MIRLIVRELQLLVCAVQFLTRLPTPRLVGFEAAWVGRSTRYFPLVGQLVGAIGALTLAACAHFWGGWLPALLAIGVTVAISGAFHEDGLADTADGLGGGQTRDKRLSIMKDSRVGTFGVLALIFSIAARVGGLFLLAPVHAGWTLIAMQGAGRAVAVAGMALPYAGDPNLAKEGRPFAPRLVSILIAALFALWPMIFLPPTAGLAGLALGLVFAAVPAVAAIRLIGGRTGDVLGAMEQAFEIGFVLGAAAVLTA